MDSEQCDPLAGKSGKSQSVHDGQVPQEIDPESGLLIGPLIADSRPARPPERVVLEGRYARLEPLEPARHRDELYAASTPTDAPARFRYLGGPSPESLEAFDTWLVKAAVSTDPLFFVVVDRATGRVEGRQTLMRITPAHRCIETGNIYWGPRIAGTRVATEALYLFAVYVLETLGYRRFEWKCDALNAPSRRAAERFGFTWEGHFRRAVIVRGRTRDTAWFSIIDEEWRALKAAYQRWLSPDNFDSDGRQKTRLSELTTAALAV